MEEKKFDPYQFIGFILIALIMTWMLYNQQPVEETPSAPQETEVEKATPEATVVNDSIQQMQYQATYGDFARLAQPNGEDLVVLENEELYIAVDPHGAQLNTVKLKNFTEYQGKPLFLVQDNQKINYQFTTLDGRTLNTRDLYFSPYLTKKDGKTELQLKAELGAQQFFAFVYALDATGYMLDFSIQSQGLSTVVNNRLPHRFTWDLEAFRNSRSIEYENRYTELTYAYADDKVDNLSLSGADQEEESDVRWIGYKQHFFSSILIPARPIENVAFASEDLSGESALEERFTKRYESAFELEVAGDFIENYQWYFGPTEYKTLALYESGIEEIVDFGWGIFGWINRAVFTPLFSFLSSFLPYGIAIIVMTILVRLAMSPVTYKSYLSQIKMKVLKPEVDEINAKYKDDAVKRQQEVMALYGKAGANPMAGCLPALLQLPVFYALFSFFPVAFALRQKSFLWADDLSSYDSVLSLPFSIPFYGDHVSLFPILASIAIFIYTMMTAGQQQAPQQPGMPNMKIIMYLMPLMMLFFFNNYASGLSLYYFISNLLTIALMLVIKNFIVDENKIHLQLEENKKKPKKAGGFTARLQKAMEEAEKQQRVKQKRKR